MEYEVFEPLEELDDEFYDEICEAAWARMWNSDIHPVAEVDYV